MTHRNQIILSKLTPPAQRSSVLARPRVVQLLRDCLVYPVTVVVSETGYGKTTSALTLTQSLDIPVFWYTVSRNERDPRLFLSYLCTSFNQGKQKLGQPALRVLEDNQANFKECLIVLLNSISMNLTQEALLVLDDFQGMHDSQEILEIMDWFIEHLPGNLHVLILSRLPLDFPSMNKWQIRGKLLKLDKESLRFSVAETDQLYKSTYQLELDQEDLSLVHRLTEGWAIGLQVVWQSIKAFPELDLSSLLQQESEPSRVNLFDYLAEEVLDMQTEEHKNFLINTSILQFLDSDTCDFLMDTQDSAKMLGELYKSGLFIEQLKPDVLRYHHIFRGFLQSQLHKYPEKTKNLHRKVASYYRAHHYWERAIAHLISAGDFTRVRQILDDVGDRLLQSGLKHSVRYWMTQLPEEEMAAYPYGNYLLGEVERTEARFDQALESYRTAQRLYQSQNNAWGMSLAMRGQAQVYLDTLRPINANQLLENALSLLEPAEYPQEVSELLTQIAENQVNQGAMAEAERSLQKARELSPIKSETQSFIEARLLLRTGRLDEGIRLLEELDPGKVEDVLHRPQRFHRETSLLLSLFYSLKGEQEIARDYAKEGLQVSRQLQASYVEAVAKIRLGHALQLDLQQGQDSHGMQQIQDLYEYAIQHVDILRIHVEPLWGLCRLVGYAGRLEEAKTIADKALVIAGNAGDEWIGLLVRISLGAALALAGDYEAASDVLSLANSLADKVNDNLAKTASLIWQSYAAQKQGFKNSAILFLEQALGLVQQHDYQFLLTRASLLGSDDPYTFYPLLQWARQMQVKPDLVMQILISASVGADYHPGYRLGLKLLGGFEARKGKHLVSSDQWKREKARQMLQALALNRTKGISKEQLAMYFWPAAEEPTANNNFKVTLSALNQVLEPERPPKESPYFIIRNGDQYQLNPQAHIYLDIDEFERLARSHDLMDWEKALDLYKGRLLDGEPLQEYFMSDTQYYHRLYLDILVKLIDASLLQKDFEKALELSNRLVRQEPLLEVGYLFQMRIYAAMGNTALVHKVYQQALDVNQAVYGPGTEPDELKNLYFNLTR